jgi:plasmid stabilization system protein ParE
MNQVVLSPGAERDLHILWDRIARRSVSHARRTIAAFFDMANLLTRAPVLHPTRRDLTEKPVCFWPFDRYLIVYRILPRRIEIVGITHKHIDIPEFVHRHES